MWSDARLGTHGARPVTTATPVRGTRAASPRDAAGTDLPSPKVTTSPRFFHASATHVSDAKLGGPTYMRVAGNARSRSPSCRLPAPTRRDSSRRRRALPRLRAQPFDADRRRSIDPTVHRPELLVRIEPGDKLRACRRAPSRPIPSAAAGPDAETLRGWIRRQFG